METRLTESDSFYDNLETKNISELLSNINKEDKTVAFAVERQLKRVDFPTLGKPTIPHCNDIF